MTDRETIDVLVATLEARAAELEARERPRSGPAEDALLGTSATPLPRAPAPRREEGADLQSLLASDGDRQFIDRAYRRVLGREPDASGRSNYLAALEAGKPRAFVLTSLAFSREGQGSGMRWRLAPIWPLIKLSRVPRCGRLARGIYRAGRSLRTRLAAVVRGGTPAGGDEVNTGADSLNAVINRLADAVEGALTSHARAIRRGDERLREAEAASAERLDRQNAALALLRRRLDQRASAGAPQVGEVAGEAALADYYVDFELACRGSREAVRDGLAHYLPLIQMSAPLSDAAPLLDLGAGRGEWLELLTEHGIQAQGVELNRFFVEECRSYGLDIIEADALAVLQQRSDGSIAAITALHVIEHLPFAAAYTLVQEAFRVLAPGGVLILETPNPENVLVGSHTFYHDPTHRNPVTPTGLTHLVIYHGFHCEEVRRLNPYPPEAPVPGDDLLTQRVNGHLYGPQDYAVIARRPPEEAAG